MSREPLGTARLRYSGIILFASKILGIVTGLLYTMIVTRRLNVPEFGTWQYVTVLFSYFIIPSSFTGFWVTRNVSRGDRLATTGLILNLLLSIPATLLYIVASIPASEVTDINLVFFLIITPQICLMFLLTLLEAVALGIKPYLVGYGSVIFEFTKICLGALLVLNMKLGLFGALISVEMAYALQTAFMTVLLRGELSRSFSKDAAKRWLMLAWIPLFSSLSFQLQQMDSIITTFITRSTIPIAMLKAANVFSTTISFSAYAASALYPRLLAGVGEGDMETSVRLVSLLAIPSVFGIIVLADPLLAILRREYVEAAMVLRISVVTTAIVALSSVAEAAILATEKVDTSGTVNFTHYLRSKLALIPILGFIYDGVYLSIVFVVVSYLSTIGAGPIEIAISIAIIALVVTIPLISYKWLISKRVVSFKFPFRSVASYVIAASAMSALILLLNPSDAVSTEIGKVFIGLIPKIAVGGITYLLLVIILDEEPRTILKGVLRHVGVLKTEG